MKFGEAFSFVFQDPDWFKKTVIPGLIGLLIPIIGQMVLLGWGLKIALNVIRNNPNPLPELSFGDDLSRGFKATVVSIVYGLPMLIFYIPIIIISGLAANSNENTAIIIALGSTCFGLLMMLYGIAMAYILPAAYARVAVDDTIAAGLNFKEVFNLVKKVPMSYLLVLVGVLASSFISSLGSIACGIVIFLTVPYATAILNHLYGQAYLDAKYNEVN